MHAHDGIPLRHEGPWHTDPCHPGGTWFPCCETPAIGRSAETEGRLEAAGQGWQVRASLWGQKRLELHTVMPHSLANTLEPLGCSSERGPFMVRELHLNKQRDSESNEDTSDLSRTSGEMRAGPMSAPLASGSREQRPVQNKTYMERQWLNTPQIWQKT